MPKLRLAASVPAIDWNTRSTGAPRSIASIVVVTWVSTQALGRNLVGVDDIVEHAAAARSTAGTLSVAGLMPITASPLP